MCRIVHSTGAGVAAVDGVGSHGDVICVSGLSLSAAETVCVYYSILFWLYVNAFLSLFLFVIHRLFIERNISTISVHCRLLSNSS